MIVESFYSHLSSDAGITAITTGIWPQTIPQGQSAPALTYRVNAELRDQLLDGVSSLKTASFDVDCWSLTYLEAHELADAVEAALVGTTGVFGSASPSDSVDHIRLERKFDLFETDTKLHRVSLQFLVAYY